MRSGIALSLLILAGCSIDNDAAQDKVTVKYDEQRIRKSAAETARTAKAVATGAANVAAGTARAIKKEVGDVDVDVKVSRKRSDQGQTPQPEPSS